MDYMTVAEAAALLGVSRATVQRRCLAGELPYEKVTARLYLIPREAVNAAMHGRKAPGRKPSANAPTDH